MINETLNEIYNKFRINFYMKVFSKFENREATLTTVEAFSMECIMALKGPTIAEFAKMMNISAPNAAYRVNSLLKKGYIVKEQSKIDQREYHLLPSDKYMDYYKIGRTYIDTISKRCKERFSEEDYKKLNEYLTIINDELMPELNLERFKNH